MLCTPREKFALKCLPYFTTKIHFVLIIPKFVETNRRSGTILFVNSIYYHCFIKQKHKGIKSDQRFLFNKQISLFVGIKMIILFC